LTSSRYETADKADPKTSGRQTKRVDHQQQGAWPATSRSAADTQAKKNRKKDTTTATMRAFEMNLRT